jgi:hypothetical protein
VYHCTTRCNDYASGRWGVGNHNSDSWNYYDTGLALYRYYLRTGNSTDLTRFRTFTDTWWAWTLNQMGEALITARGTSLVSQFVRALDGHPERFLPIYNFIKNGCCVLLPDGNDNREPGYYMLWLAVGAKADPDSTRHSWYCTTLQSTVQTWVTLQRPEGYWSEKNSLYPYQTPGASPWRMFSVTQGLARAYDVLDDTTSAGCDNPALAQATLTSVKRAAEFLYNYGYAPQNRGVFYDVQYVNDGQDGLNNGLKAGTVSVLMGSAAVTGKGTAFTKTFTIGSYIGIMHSDGNAWTHRVVSIADDSHLTVAENWGSECFSGSAGLTCAMTDSVGEPYYQTDAAPTNCGSFATSCWSGQGNGPLYLNGDRNNNRDPIWIMGWLYKTTGIPIYKTWGDELFSASYGGPAGGPGSNYPGDPGPCGGPGCDGALTDYMEAIHGCGNDPRDPTIPCNPRTGYPGYYGNAQVFTAKRFAQGSGIGGADNYLAWRLAAPTGRVPDRGSTRRPTGH